MRSNVDLPQPDGPTITTNSPSLDRHVDAVQHELFAVVGLFDGVECQCGHAVLALRAGEMGPDAARRVRVAPLW